MLSESYGTLPSFAPSSRSRAARRRPSKPTWTLQLLCSVRAPSCRVAVTGDGEGHHRNGGARRRRRRHHHLQPARQRALHRRYLTIPPSPRAQDQSPPLPLFSVYGSGHRISPLVDGDPAALADLFRKPARDSCETLAHFAADFFVLLHPVCCLFSFVLFSVWWRPLEFMASWVLQKLIFTWRSNCNRWIIYARSQLCLMGTWSGT